MNKLCVVLGIGLSEVLAGCGSLGVPNYQDMAANQINAAVKDKSSTIVCTKIPTPWGVGESLIANIDKTTGTAGGEFSMECGSAKAEYKDMGKAITPVSTTTTTQPIK